MHINAGVCGRDFGHDGAAGRQGRAFGAPLRGRRALTALRRREIGLPCCRGSLSVTSGDVSDLASSAQSASASLCKTLQNASIQFRSLQNPQCKIMQFRAKKCFRMLQNASFCCVHTCASGPSGEQLSLPKTRFVRIGDGIRLYFGLLPAAKSWSEKAPLPFGSGSMILI